MRIIQTAVALSDAVHISSGMINQRVSNVFNQSLERTYLAIEMTPTIGSLVEQFEGTIFADIRVCTVRRFRNYVVFYRIVGDEVLIERILDGRRDLVELFISG